MYDFYAKQLLHARSQSPRQSLLDPFPGLDGGTFGHWGNQTEESWRSGARNEMDVGTVQAEIFQGWGMTVSRAVCVRLGESGQMSACFDPDSLRWVAAWTGGSLTFGNARFGFLEGVRPAGERVPLEEAQAGTAVAAGTFTYHGFYRAGPRVVFHYTRDGRGWLESAWCDNGRFVRTVEPATPERLRRLAAGAGAQWPQVFPTVATLGTGSPYAVDTVAVPAATPWRSLFHLGDHDFFPNGDAAVCTFEGEVWLVRGLRDGLDQVRWKRFAAGLHQALGLKIHDGKIYVRGRDQITRLHDGNGDDEADYYECFSTAAATSIGGHDYTTGLQCDAEGRFYFASSHQGVCRVSADGQTNEVLATGFRNPNGLGLGPHGEMLVAVQEGDWTPASMIAEVVAGGHYGHGGPRSGPLGHLPPVVYLPRGIDHSCGGQVFVEGDRWGMPPGMLVHLSFGAAMAFVVARDTAHPAQGMVAALPGDFASGVHRGRFHPLDGQLWVSGMTGWVTYGPEAGCLQRLRYTGGNVGVPVSFEARDNGLLLTFAEPVAGGGSTAGWLAQSWNYRYSGAYGSDEFSAREPGMAGHDWLDVAGVHALGDGRTVFLEIPQLQPAHTVHVHAADAAGTSRDYFFTLHRLGPPFTEFPGYHAVAKVPLPADGQGSPIIDSLQPVSWEQGEPGRPIVIEAAPGLQFSPRVLTAKAGERLSLTFDNPDVIPHNWVLGTRGSTSQLFALANQFIADPRAYAMHYVPPTPDILVYTRLVEPAATTSIHFNAPAEPGDYPYLCTFPGHAAIMRGVLQVR
jgi:azurin